MRGRMVAVRGWLRSALLSVAVITGAIAQEEGARQWVLVDGAEVVPLSEVRDGDGGLVELVRTRGERGTYDFSGYAMNPAWIYLDGDRRDDVGSGFDVEPVPGHPAWRFVTFDGEIHGIVHLQGRPETRIPRDPQGDRVSMVNARGMNWEGTDFQTISDLPNLQYLSLAFGQGLDGADLQALSDQAFIYLNLSQISGSDVSGPAPDADPNAALDVAEIVSGSVETLRSLVLFNTPVSDESLATLDFFQELRALDLSMTSRLTDRTFRRIAELRRLRFLNLAATAIGDEPLASLAELPHLSALSLESCFELTDDGIARLASMSSLEFLDLSFTQVSSATLIAILENNEISVLRMMNTAIDDQAVEALVAEDSLEFISLIGSDISDAGVERIIEAHGPILEAMPR